MSLNCIWLLWMFAELLLLLAWSHTITHTQLRSQRSYGIEITSSLCATRKICSTFFSFQWIDYTSWLHKDIFLMNNNHHHKRYVGTFVRENGSQIALNRCRRNSHVRSVRMHSHRLHTSIVCAVGVDKTFIRAHTADIYHSRDLWLQLNKVKVIFPLRHTTLKYTCYFSFHLCVFHTICTDTLTVSLFSLSLQLSLFISRFVINADIFYSDSPLLHSLSVCMNFIYEACKHAFLDRCRLHRRVCVRSFDFLRGAIAGANEKSNTLKRARTSCCVLFFRLKLNILVVVASPSGSELVECQCEAKTITLGREYIRSVASVQVLVTHWSSLRPHLFLWTLNISIAVFFLSDNKITIFK